MKRKPMILLIALTLALVAIASGWFVLTLDGDAALMRLENEGTAKQSGDSSSEDLRSPVLGDGEAEVQDDGASPDLPPEAAGDDQPSAAKEARNLGELGPEEEAFELILRGRVVDIAGAGIAQASITAAEDPYGWPFPKRLQGNTLSAEDGAFVLTVSGSILREKAPVITTQSHVEVRGYLWVSEEGILYTIHLHSNHPDYAPSVSSVSFCAIDTKKGFLDVTITLDPKSDLIGRVVDGDGQPVPLAFVRATGPKSPDSLMSMDFERGVSATEATLEARSDEKGEFRIEGVASGTWNVEAFPPGIAVLDSAEIFILNGIGFYFEPGSAALQSGEKGDVQLTEVPIAQVIFRVATEGVSKVNVILNSRDQNGADQAN